jgi:hypothetical protein
MLVLIVVTLLSVWIIRNGSKMAKSITHYENLLWEDADSAAKEIGTFTRENHFLFQEMIWITISLPYAIYLLVYNGDIGRFFLEIIFCTLIIMRWSIYYDIVYPFEIPRPEAKIE